MEQIGQPGSPAQVGPPGQPGPVGCVGEDEFRRQMDLRPTPKQWWDDYRASMVRLERWQALRRRTLVPTSELVALAFQVGCDDQRVSDQGAWAREALTAEGWDVPGGDR